MIYFNGVTDTTVQSTEHLYVVRDEQILSGEPIIKGTRTSVRAIVETWRMGVALSGAELRFAVDLKAFSGMVPSAVEPKQ